MKRGISIRRLWVFDFDGTLSPLVPDRTVARLHPASLALLKDLVADPRDRVAVLSSRTLEDIVPRVPVPQVYLGGGCGLEWRIPGGDRIFPRKKAERKMEERRGGFLRLLERFAAFPGVELEDKRYSVAIHFRRVLPEARPVLFPLLAELKRHPGIRCYEGPSVAEVLFIPSANKSFGLRRLCRLLDFDSSRGRILYAGDDENDATAMRWVLSRKGTVFAVGGMLKIAGARYADGPASLARGVRELQGIPGSVQTKTRRIEAAG